MHTGIPVDEIVCNILQVTVRQKTVHTIGNIYRYLNISKVPDRPGKVGKFFVVRGYAVHLFRYEYVGLDYRHSTRYQVV